MPPPPQQLNPDGQPIIKTTGGDRTSSPAAILTAVQEDVDITSATAAAEHDMEPQDSKEAEQTHRIRVTDPERCGDKEPFVMYTILSSGDHRVKRRFQDFADLHAVLQEANDAVILPPLPSKSNFEFKDKFNPEFTERRRKSLERFLNRLIEHPVLREGPKLKAFLTEQNIIIRHGNQSTSSLSNTAAASGISSIVDRFGDVLSGIGIFPAAKGQHPEDRFEGMRETCRRLEGHYIKLEEILTHLYKAQRSMEEGMRGASRELMQVEAAILQLRVGLGDNPDTDSLQETLTGLSLLYERQAVALHDFAALIKADLSTPVHECGKYCGVALEALKARDEKCATAEELAQYLLRSRHQLAELKGGHLEEPLPGQDSLLAPLKSSAKAVGGYLSDQLDRFKGLDTLSAKQAKLAQLEKRIGDLEQAAKAARETSAHADEVIDREMEHFERVLQAELKDSLIPALVAHHRLYIDQTTARWKAALPDGEDDKQQ